MFFDAGGSIALRCHRFSFSRAALLISWLFVMFDSGGSSLHRSFLRRVTQARAFRAASSAHPFLPKPLSATTSHRRHSLSITRCLTGLPASNFPSNIETVLSFWGFNGVKLHRPDPYPPLTTEMVSPPQVSLLPYLGRVLVICVLTPPLVCIIASPNRKKLSSTHLERSPDIVFKPPPPNSLCPSPIIGSCSLNLVDFVDWLLRCCSEVHD